jgi:hypothetical protein
LIYLLPTTRSHRRSASPFRIAVCLLLTLGVLSEPSVAGAKAEPRKPPAPEKLWKAYPLNPSPSQPERRSRPGNASVPQRSRPESLEQGDSWTLIASIAATVAALGLAFALAPAAFVRARRSHRLGAAAARLGARLRRAPQATLRLEPHLRHSRPALATANVVDDLLQAVAGGARAAKPMQSHVHALAAGGASESSAHERPRDRAEVELLRAKRTGADRNGVDILKAKLKSEATTCETSGLKDKLRTRQESETVHPKRSAPRPPQPPKRLQAVSAGVPMAAAASGECEIALRHRNVTSLFYAAVASPDGTDRVVATSPEFRWGKSRPPPEDRSDVRRAHHGLVKQLEAAGWVPSGEGPEWFAFRFRQRRADGAALQRLP